MTADGYRLGAWISRQRRLKDRMSGEQRSRLDALGFVWDPFTAQWEEGFQHLQAFVNEHGHCRVTHKYVTTGGFRLGAWANGQRYKSVSAERRARLDVLGFVWSPGEKRDGSEPSSITADS